MSDALRLLLVDDQALVRTGFRLILERAGFEVAGEAADGVEAVDLAQQLRPDVVLMDLRMPRLDGIEATRRILAGTAPAPRVLALTTFDLDEYVYAAVRAGASGFLLKDAPPEDLVHAVRVVARGDTLLAPRLVERLLTEFASRREPRGYDEQLAALSARETEVARLVARGLSNTDIGKAMFLSEATVKTYVSRLLTKLDLRDRVQVAVFAYESGLVEVGGPGSPGR